MTTPNNLMEHESSQHASCAVLDPPVAEAPSRVPLSKRAAGGRGAARHNVLGVGISDINLSTAVAAIRDHIQRGDRGYVCVTGVHGVMVAQDCRLFRSILNSSFLTTPDGMPMVWVGKWNRCRDIQRVYGPDLMLEVLRDGLASGRTHYLYGGGDGVAEKLAERLRELAPGVKIVGTYTPPFRPLNEAEERALVEEVDRLSPDCFWVGLSTPKQERFMDAYLPKLNTRLMFGVGAAFDFHAGLLKQAPGWMQRSGMEWFFRLCMEPRRLWKRYVFGNTRFVTRIAPQIAAGRPKSPLTATITAPQSQPGFGAARTQRFDNERAAPATGLSVVVPLYNEAQCVQDLIDSLDAMQKSTDRYNLEFVFVDDASTDNTAQLVHQQAAGRLDYTVVRHGENRGIAAAIDTGLRAARHNLAASIDADCTYDPETVLRLAPLVKGDVIMATASPYHPDGKVLNLPAWRIALSRAASRVYGLMLPQPITCYTCCVRAYNRREILNCRPANDGFVGVAELSWNVMRQGGRIAEAPAVLRPRTAGVSKMRTLRATLGHTRLLARIAAARLFPRLTRQTDAPLGAHLVLEPATQEG